MKHPVLAIFMIALAVPLMSCTIAGYIALSAVQPVNPPAESQAVISEVSSSSIQESKSAAVSTISQKNTGLKLIDISHFTNVTDWKAVSSSVNGIYIKATEGTSITDPKFQANAASAMGAKIPTGFYHYFWPGADTASSAAQADYFYKTIKNYDYKLYPVVDVEETNNQSNETICADIKAFAAGISETFGN